MKVGFPGVSDSKESACNARDPGLILGSGRSPGEMKWQPTPGFLPGEFYGQRSQVSYSPGSHRDTTEQLTYTKMNEEQQPQRAPEKNLRKGSLRAQKVYNYTAISSSSYPIA